MLGLGQVERATVVLGIGGDDVNDKDSLMRTKYPITVPNAVETVKNIPNIQITKNVGGNGAFREIVDVLLD